jgi:hypothetical protein
MSHTWKFFRTGGFDQVRIDTAADLLNLRELDQKLWVALSCPTTGIEFDARTLALIDNDGDGHIRAPELLGAIDWAAARLTDAAVLEQALAGVPLAAIKDETILAAAKGLLPAGEAMVTVEAASAAEAEYSARALAAWEASGADSKPLGEATEAACAALAAVKEKLDDFFVRCRLAAFDDRAGGAMNASDDSLKSLGAATLSAEHADIAALPLAKVPSGTQSAGAGGTAPLAAGVNPAWAARMATLRDAAVTPVLGARESLSEADWAELQARLAPFTAWQAARPAGLPAEAEAVRDLERLSRYVRDLMTLANNFVAFRNFYARQGKATFQIGTLYLDGRAAELCVAVNDAARHAALASLSRICLVYCDCVRVGGNGGEKLSIAAAFTAGDSDQLMALRNGVFYDRQGRDWDATITKVLDHPISLRQAFWSPYKKLGRMVSEQMQKMAASRAAAAEAKAAEAAVASVAKGAPPPPPKAPFDAGKFAGIFAAIGLAIGAIGTALAAMLTGLLGLKAWQIPLAIAALLLVISLPAVIVAWFKLRSRTLGPILDANGWAINARACINIPFGTSLTQLARLPEGAERALADPYAEKEQPWKTYAFLAVVLFAALVWLTR